MAGLISSDFRMDPSPMCGPFRIYDAPTEIITIQITNSHQWFQSLWEIVSNTAVIAMVIVLLA